MKSLGLLAPLSFALPATSIFVLCPLYVYPGDSSASAWDPITAAIEAYPTVQWQVIVNPDSGPGTTSYPTDTTYTAAIAKLNSYPNVLTLGYVDTKFTQRTMSAVIIDVDAYGSWASYSAANISIGGIFFDDVNNTASDDVYTYMSEASAYARSKVNPGATQVVFNPGSIAPTPLFDDCDTIVEFENPYSSYLGAATIETIPSEYRDQSAIIAYDAPSGMDVAGVVQTMVSYRVEAVYFDTRCCYNAPDATLANHLAAAVLDA